MYFNMGGGLGTDIVKLIKIASQIPVKKRFSSAGINYIRGRHANPKTLKKAWQISKMALWQIKSLVK